PSAVVQWAARVKPAVKVILRIRIAGHPMVKGDMGPVVELDIPCYHVLLEADGQAEHLTPAVDQGVNVGRPPPDRHGDPELPAMCRAAEGFPGEASIEARRDIRGMTGKAGRNQAARRDHLARH